MIRATTFPQFNEQFCSLIKTRLQITAIVITDKRGSGWVPKALLNFQQIFGVEVFVPLMSNTGFRGCFCMDTTYWYLGLSDTDGLDPWIPITLSFFDINKYYVRLTKEFTVIIGNLGCVFASLMQNIPII